jgi:hypothetical protein
MAALLVVVAAVVQHLPPTARAHDHLPDCRHVHEHGVDQTQAGGPQFVVGSPRPWPGAEPLEGVKYGREVGARVAGGLGAAQMLAVEGLDPGQVERPAVGAGDGQSLLEEFACLVVGGGDGCRSSGD